MPPQKFREIVLQLLYAKEFDSDASPLLMAELKVARGIMAQAREKVARIEEKREWLAEQVKNRSQAYAFDRISRVERLILYLSLYEIHVEGLEPAIAIAEAGRLTRKFGTPESAQFVHALLHCEESLPA